MSELLEKEHQLPEENNGSVDFVKKSSVELGRVNWPNAKTVWQLAGTVIAFVLLVGVITGFVDNLAADVINKIY